MQNDTICRKTQKLIISILEWEEKSIECDRHIETEDWKLHALRIHTEGVSSSDLVTSGIMQKKKTKTLLLSICWF